MEEHPWGRSPTRHRTSSPIVGSTTGPPAQVGVNVNVPGSSNRDRSGSFGSYFGAQQPPHTQQPQQGHPFVSPHHMTHMPQQLFMLHHDDERMAILNHHHQQQQQQQQQHHHHLHQQQQPTHHLAPPHPSQHSQPEHSPQRHSIHHAQDYGGPPFYHKDQPARRMQFEGEKLVARMGMSAKGMPNTSPGLGIEEMGDILDRGEVGGDRMRSGGGGGGGIGGEEDGSGGEGMADGGLKQEYSVLLERGDEEEEWGEEEYSFLQGGGVIYYDDLVEGGGATEEEFTAAFEEEQSTGGAWTGLDMGRIGLTLIGPEILFYPNLTSLYLNNNKFSDIPEPIFQLTRLARLDLSYNNLQRLPPEIGRLIRLEELSLYRNKIRELPPEMGRLYRLKLLQVDGNPITSPPFSLIKQGAEAVVTHLRDKLPLPPPPPPRLWLEFPRRNGDMDEGNEDKIKVLCYNILAEKYAIPELLSYCPSQYLKWSYRRNKILEEVLSYDCDFLALQEVEAGAYKQFFEPEMSKMGYAGVFKPKSRARTMGDWNSVDGCVLFYKPDRFELLDEFWIEFQSTSIKRYEKEFSTSAQALDRLISKDQIAIATVFRCKKSANKNNTNNGSQDKSSTDNSSLSNTSKIIGNHLEAKKSKPKDKESDEEDSLIMIVNTHIHWDPAFADVKLMQVCMLLEELETITTPLSPAEAAVVAKYGIGDQPVYVDTFTAGLSNETAKKIMTKRYPGIPMLICGDFNSMPDSGVYEYIRKGQISGGHADFGGFDYGRYSRAGPQHPFNLASAYEEIGEPAFTNYTDGFVGCLDYMFYSKDKFEVVKILQPVEESAVFDQTGALPNAYMCSDHICLVSEFKMKKTTKRERDREIRERERERLERTQRVSRNVGLIGEGIGGGGGGSGAFGGFGGPSGGYFYRERQPSHQGKRDF